MTRFARDLLRWFSREQRDLPWRRNRHPWSTWVSEVMLQQTTVDVVVQRFEAFLEKFPTVEALAKADEDDVVGAWSGLGYYRRARALHRGAQEVMRRHGGRVPEDSESLGELPGVGPYTAGAIRSLAFDLPAAAVDGNVARVASRLFADDGDVTSTTVRRRFGDALVELMPRSRPGAFNEALIELGALVCRPREPDCAGCPVASHCEALRLGAVRELPRKKKPRSSIPVLSARALVERGGRLLLVRRSSGASLLPGFWELPGRWGPTDEDPRAALLDVVRALGLREIRVNEQRAEARHTITHHNIRSVAWSVTAVGTSRLPASLRFLGPNEIDVRKVTTETLKLLRADAKGSWL